MDQDPSNGLKMVGPVIVTGICGMSRITNHEDECDTNIFLVVKAEMNYPEDYQYTLYELNECYPIELLEKYGLLPTTYECEDCE